MVAMREQGDAIHFINEAFRHCKPIGAIGEGVDLLTASDIKGIRSLSKSSEGGVSSELGVVITRKRTDLSEFGSKFVMAIAQHRHWGREEKERVPA